MGRREMDTTTFDHDGLFERLPGQRRNALIERWLHRHAMEELIRSHTTNTNAAMKPVDNVMALLHGGAN
jgi:hypothetical protein